MYVSDIPTSAVWASLDGSPLATRADELAPQYAAASPFPHVVLDDFLPEHLLLALGAEFPPAPEMSIQFKAKLQLKSAEEIWERMGPVTRSVLAALNAGAFVDQLEHLTGIGGLVADPHLEGGGQHQTVRGGKLGIHADFSRNERLGLERRINVLIYLTPGWQEEWGGHLEFWDDDMTSCGQRIAPFFGRSVIFTTTASSFHGVPDALACPPEVTRKSLALYYYTPVEVEPSSQEHKAVFRRRPGSDDPAVTVTAEQGLSVGRVGEALLPPILAGPARSAYRRLKRAVGRQRG